MVVSMPTLPLFFQNFSNLIELESSSISFRFPGSVGLEKNSIQSFYCSGFYFWRPTLSSEFEPTFLDVWSDGGWTDLGVVGKEKSSACLQSPANIDCHCCPHLNLLHHSPGSFKSEEDLCNSMILNPSSAFLSEISLIRKALKDLSIIEMFGWKWSFSKLSPYTGPQDSHIDSLHSEDEMRKGKLLFYIFSFSHRLARRLGCEPYSS